MVEVKKFEAATLAEVLKVVKRELGPEAIILSTKNNKGGWGLMNKASVEVTATVSREAMGRKTQAESGLSSEQRDALSRKPVQNILQSYDILSGARIQRRMREAEELTARPSNMSPTAKAQTSSIAAANQTAHAINQNRIPPTQRRYIDIEDDESVAEQISLRAQDRTQFSRSAPQAPTQSTSRQQQQQQIEVPQQRYNYTQNASFAQSTGATRSSIQIFPKLVAELIDAGVQEELVRDIGDELKSIMLREHITREDLLRLQLARVLMSRLRVARSLGERLRVPSTPRIITFLGPTGVGKTTTIAKIAAELVINQKRPVTLATTDTFKIAAVEQLQTYANILKCPLEVCQNAESLASLRDHLSPDDVVLVDTAGFGPRDEKKLIELSALLSAVRTETHLCVASTTRDTDLLQVIQRFRIFEPEYLVFTKLDETSQYGNIYNLAAKTHMPLSYFTMGQRVPEDMEVATKERVADLILNLAGGDASWTKQID
ncbi:MAG: flagellar biosynthesis protein FlhF [Bdellovibrionota bacterium]